MHTYTHINAQSGVYVYTDRCVCASKCMCVCVQTGGVCVQTGVCKYRQAVYVCTDRLYVRAGVCVCTDMCVRAQTGVCVYIQVCVCVQTGVCGYQVTSQNYVKSKLLLQLL